MFGRYVVVGTGSNLLRAEYFGSAPAKALESLGACYFVDVLTVDVKDARATFECFLRLFTPISFAAPKGRVSRRNRSKHIDGYDCGASVSSSQQPCEAGTCNQMLQGRSRA